MTRTLLTLAFIGLGFYGNGLPYLLASSPEVIAEETEVDFGLVPYGAKRSHTFTVTNRSDRTVRITSIRVPCSCVTASTHQKEIRPGETAAITAVLDTRRFGGLLRKVFYATFEGLQAEEIRFTLLANSHSGLLLEPDMFAFGSLKNGQGATRSIVLTATDRSFHHAWVAQCDSDYVKCEVEPMPAPSGIPAVRITATLRPDLPPGSWYATVHLRPATGNEPGLKIPVTVVIETK